MLLGYHAGADCSIVGFRHSSVIVDKHEGIVAAAVEKTLALESPVGLLPLPTSVSLKAEPRLSAITGAYVSSVSQS
jgi:hypothetical protein